MKALKHFVLMTMFFVSAPAVMAQSIETDWHHATYYKARTFSLDYDFGSNNREIIVEIKESTELDAAYLAVCASGVLTGDGTYVFMIGGLDPDVTYDVMISEYWNGSVYYYYVINGVTVLDKPNFDPSDFIGGTAFAPIVSIELNEYGVGFPLFVTTLYAELTNLDDGTVYVESEVLPGNGSLSQQFFSFPGLPSGNYKLCFRLTYAEGGNTNDFGPIEIINSCDEGDEVYFYHSGISLGFDANGMLVISGISELDDVQIVVTDLLGRIVDAGPAGHRFDVSSQSNSVYIVTFYSADGTKFSRKLSHFNR